MNHPIPRVPMTATLLIAGILTLSGPANAGGDQSALPSHLSEAKINLVDGVTQAAQLEGFPISAKLEMDGPELHMSVYTAKQGRDVPAEKNDLIELSGDATQAHWEPKKEVFADKPHIARASMHLTVMQQSKLGLADLLKKAAATQPGTIYSITPDVRNGKPVFKLLTLTAPGKVTESWIDAEGNKLGN